MALARNKAMAKQYNPTQEFFDQWGIENPDIFTDAEDTETETNTPFLFDLLPPEVERMIQKNVEYKKNYSECVKNIATIGEYTSESMWAENWDTNNHLTEADQTCFLFEEFVYGCRCAVLEELTKNWRRPDTYTGFSNIINREMFYFATRFDPDWQGACGFGLHEIYPNE